jgi:hypothetical protein
MTSDTSEWRRSYGRTSDRSALAVAADGLNRRRRERPRV